MDLNGKEISYNGTPLLKRGLIGVNNGGDLTIKDSSDPSTGAIRPGENAYGVVAMTVPGDTDTNVAKLTLESGTLEGYYYGIVGNGKRGNTSVTITGGSVVGTLEDNSVGIYNPQAGSLTVTGGTVEGAMGIYVKAGNPIEIKGGTVIGNGAKGEYTPTGDGTKNTGDALVVDNCGYPGGVPGISVTGGTFRSENGNAVASYAKTGYTPVVGFISGGTYNKEFDETLCVSGYKLERNPDGTYGVVISDPLAKIVREGADVMYPSLEAAIADAQQNEIIILIKNIEVQAQILVDKACTIDLNSKVITYAGGTELNTGVIGIKHGGDLTIIDNSASSTGAIKSGTNAYAAVAMTVSGDTDDTKPSKLTLNGGYLEGKYYGITGNGSEGRGNTAIVINGGTVKGTVADDNTGIYNPQSGSLTISGGRVEGATGIYVKAGNPIAITGGEIVGTGNYAKYKPATGSFNSTGDGLVIDSCGYPGGVPGISITGGTFTSTNASPVASYAKPSETLVTRFVTGGTFNDQINAFLLEEGYVLVKSATDDTYGVEYSPVAQIGEETYASLGDAIKAVPLYGEIMILRDVDDAVGITVNGGKNFTVDFNGKVYTVGKPGAGSQGTESQAFQLLQGSTIVFKDGTIRCDENNKSAGASEKPILMIINNYANLTLQEMTIDGENIAHQKSQEGTDYNSYLVSTNNGKTTISGSTITALSTDVAFDSCYYFERYETAPTVVVTNSEITGDAEADAGKMIIENGTQISGTVTSFARKIELSSANGEVSLGEGTKKATENGKSYAWADGYVIITYGSTVSGIDANSGVITVEGNSTVTSSAKDCNGGWLIVNGATINATIAVDNRSLLDIYSGYFAPIEATDSGEGSIVITGGYFKEKVADSWMPLGYSCIENKEETTKAEYPWIVTTVDAEAAVTPVGGATEYYASVEKAVMVTSSAGTEFDKYNGATITLLKPAEIEKPSSVEFKRPVTFDLGGKILTVANSDGVGNIQIHENVTVRNGYIRTTQQSVEAKAYSVFEIEADGKILTLQSIDIEAYCPISLARDNAAAVIEDYKGSSIPSKYQVHTLVAASGGNLAGNKKLTINAGNFHITSWAYNEDAADKCHNAYAVNINGGSFIIDAWNNEAVKAKNETTISAGTFNLVPDEDFVVIPEGSYIIVDNANDAVGCVVSKDKTSAEACVKAKKLTDTNIYYTDLAKTIAAAAEGTTVMLANDVNHSDTEYRVKPNVTVDLAGYLLTCKAYTSQTGGYTMDSTLGVGAICTADREKPSVTIEEDNHGYISIVDPSCGCRFFSYGVRKSGPTQDKTDSKKYRIQYVIDIKDKNGDPDHSSKAYELMAAGNDVCGLSFVTDVSYRNKDYHFKYETLNLMKEYGQAQYNNSAIKAIEAYYILHKCESGDVLEVTATIKGITDFKHEQKYKKTFQ